MLTSSNEPLLLPPTIGSKKRLIDGQQTKAKSFAHLADNCREKEKELVKFARREKENKELGEGEGLSPSINVKRSSSSSFPLIIIHNKTGDYFCVLRRGWEKEG